MMRPYLDTAHLPYAFAVADVLLSFSQASAALAKAHPPLVLYALLALTYAVAAGISWAARHWGLMGCYGASSVLHGLLGANHYVEALHSKF